MAQGKVQVNNLNLSQGDFPDIERKLLFIGEAPGNLLSENGEPISDDNGDPILDAQALPHGEVMSFNSQTDFDDVFGPDDASSAKVNLVAAQLNAGQNWFCWFIPMGATDTTTDYLEAIDDAMEYDLKASSPEGIVVLDPAASTVEITVWYDKVMALLGSMGRQLFVLVALPGIDVNSETWASYEGSMTSMVASIAANRAAGVPQLHGNDIGIVAGRLCNRAVTVADSPMRVETGPVLGLGTTPVDSAGKKLNDATLSSLDNARISCIQHYPDYPGTYWGDVNMFEAPAGDYQVIEYLRPVLKVARAIRVLAIARIGDRKFNETQPSIEFHKTYFARPMREMSKSTVVLGRTFVGELQPPDENAITILWHTKFKVELFIVCRPYGSPKDITANIILDLTLEGGAS